MKKNYNGLDLLKAISIVFVIITHSLGNSNLLNEFVLDSAVPFFIMSSGFLFTLSFEKIALDINMQQIIKWQSKKLIKFILPYMLLFMLEYLFYYFFTNSHLLGTNPLTLFITGGFGPGGYYLLIVIQLIIIYPLIYKLIVKYDNKGLLLICLLNLAYEILKNLLNLNEDAYRLISFRYLFIFAFGIYVYKKNAHISKRFLLMLTIVGILYKCLVYTNCFSPIIFNFWNSTCMVSCFTWTFIFICFVNMQKENYKYVNLIGKNTYYIYLTQCYYFFLGICSRIIFINILFEILFNILVCLSTGLLLARFFSILGKDYGIR